MHAYFFSVCGKRTPLTRIGFTEGGGLRWRTIEFVLALRFPRTVSVVVVMLSSIRRLTLPQLCSQDALSNVPPLFSWWVCPSSRTRLESESFNCTGLIAAFSCLSVVLAARSLLNINQRKLFCMIISIQSASMLRSVWS